MFSKDNQTDAINAWMNGRYVTNSIREQIQNTRFFHEKITCFYLNLQDAFFGGDNNLNLIIDHFYLCGTRYEKWKKWWENIINLFRARTQYSWKQLDFRKTKRISVFFICFYINLLMLIKPFELIFFCVFTQLKTQTACIHAFHTLVAEAVTLL